MPQGTKTRFHIGAYILKNLERDHLVGDRGRQAVSSRNRRRTPPLEQQGARLLNGFLIVSRETSGFISSEYKGNEDHELFGDSELVANSATTNPWYETVARASQGPSQGPPRSVRVHFELDGRL